MNVQAFSQTHNSHTHIPTQTHTHTHTHTHTSFPPHIIFVDVHHHKLAIHPLVARVQLDARVVLEEELDQVVHPARGARRGQTAQGDPHTQAGVVVS